MHQWQRALALEDVAKDLLAVHPLGANQIEQVVTDLEGRTEVKPESHQRIRIRPTARSDDRADAKGMNGRVPARLVHDQLEVVRRSEERRVGKECRSRWTRER